MTDKPIYVQWDDPQTGEHRYGEVDDVRKTIRIVKREEAGESPRILVMTPGAYRVLARGSGY